jgi:hypothetical protein
MLAPNLSMVGWGVPVPSKVTFIKGALLFMLSLFVVVWEKETRTDKEMSKVKERRAIVFLLKSLKRLHPGTAVIIGNHLFLLICNSRKSLPEFAADHVIINPL